MGERTARDGQHVYLAGARRRWRVVGTLAAGLCLSLAPPCVRAAQQTSVALEYELGAGADTCPAADEFTAGVTRQLGFDPFRASANRRVSVQLSRRDGAGFEGRIRWSDAGGQWVGDRLLTSHRSDCADVAASVAFSVAVQIQFLATMSPDAPVPEPPAPVAPPPIVPPPPPPPPPVAVEPPPPETTPRQPVGGPRLFLGAGPALALSLAPAPTGLGRLFVSALWEHLSLEVAADATWPSRQDKAPSGGGFTLNRFAASAAVCGHLNPVAACVIGNLGLLQARGFGVDNPATPLAPFGQVGGRLVARQDFGDRFFVAARVEGLVMLSTWRVTLNETVAWTTPRVGALLGLDVGARFF